MLLQVTAYYTRFLSFSLQSTAIIVDSLSQLRRNITNKPNDPPLLVLFFAVNSYIGALSLLRRNMTNEPKHSDTNNEPVAKRRCLGSEPLVSRSRKYPVYLNSRLDNSPLLQQENAIMEKSMHLGFSLSLSTAECICDILKTAQNEDPLVILFWNSHRLAALDNLFMLPAIQEEIQNAGLENVHRTKGALLQWMDRHGAERIGPEAFSSEIRYFREPSIMESCRRDLAQALPFAHVLTPIAAARVHQEVEEAVARTLVVSKTERTRPDLYEGSFFYL